MLRLRLEREVPGSGYVFSTRTGVPLGTRNARRSFRLIKKRAGTEERCALGNRRWGACCQPERQSRALA